MSDTIDAVLLFPFKFLRAPDLELNYPKRIYRPHGMLVFILVFLSYYCVYSGFIYDIITETPSIGGYRDPMTGMIKPQAILPGRINGQYIVEGAAAGFMFCMGAFGFILLDQATKKDNRQYSLLMVILGTTFILIGYNLSILLIKMKVFNYLR